MVFLAARFHLRRFYGDLGGVYGPAWYVTSIIKPNKSLVPLPFKICKCLFYTPSILKYKMFWVKYIY